MGLAATLVLVPVAAVIAAIMVYGAFKQLVITGRWVWKALT